MADGTMAEDGAPHATLVEAHRAHVRPWVPLIRTFLRPRAHDELTGGRDHFI